MAEARSTGGRRRLLDCETARRRKARAFLLVELFIGPEVGHSFENALPGRNPMDGIIYLVGLIVIIMAILSFLGLH
jgi:hypothetical protein